MESSPGLSQAETPGVGTRSPRESQHSHTDPAAPSRASACRSLALILQLQTGTPSPAARHKDSTCSRSQSDAT